MGGHFNNSPSVHGITMDLKEELNLRDEVRRLTENVEKKDKEIIKIRDCSDCKKSRKI